jgi:hypothetical protein
MGVDIPINRVTWKPCWRIVPSRFPPIQLFERVADPRDLEAVFEVESMTNDRIRDEVGNLGLVTPKDRVSGEGSSPIMAAFTHLNPEGSRFSDGKTFGAFYAGHDLGTAVTETKYHRERFMRATHQGKVELDMRAYVTDLDGNLHDIRGMRDAMADIYDPDDYSAGQHLARTLRTENSWGIVYESVRHASGQCVAILRPKALSNCRQERHLCYVWDDNAISMIYEKREYTWPRY